MTTLPQASTPSAPPAQEQPTTQATVDAASSQVDDQARQPEDEPQASAESTTEVAAIETEPQESAPQEDSNSPTPSTQELTEEVTGQKPTVQEPTEQESTPQDAASSEAAQPDGAVPNPQAAASELQQPVAASSALPQGLIDADATEEPGQFKITVAGGETVSMAQIAQEPEKYKLECADVIRAYFNAMEGSEESKIQKIYRAFSGAPDWRSRAEQCSF